MDVRSEPADLQKDTAVFPIDPRNGPRTGEGGLFAANIPDAWSWRLPSGGVLMTTALRAMRSYLSDPELHLVSATTIFCSPVPAGACEIDVRLLRRGNAVTQLRAALRALSSTGPDLEVSATFSRHREAFDLADTRPPSAVLHPEQAPDLKEHRRGEGSPRFHFLDNFDSRLGLGNIWWKSDWAPGQARYARWMRYRVPQRLASGLFDPLAIPPIADLMPPALRQKLGPKGPHFHAPSLDLTVHFLDPTDSEWILVSVWARRARAGYATAEAELFDEEGRLIAYATQTMILRRSG